MLKQVHIQNYKSIEKAVVDLEPFTILVGPNGAGKSNFVDALQFVADSLNIGVDAALRHRGGFDAVGHFQTCGKLRDAEHPWARTFGFRLRMDLPNQAKADYSFEIEWLRPNEFHVKTERCEVQVRGAAPTSYEVKAGHFVREVPGIRPQIDPTELALRVVSAAQEYGPVYDFVHNIYHYNVGLEMLRNPQAPDPGERLRRGGGNEAAILRSIEGTEGYERLCRFLSLVSGGVETVVRCKPLGPQLTFEFEQTVNDEVTNQFYPRSMSDGTLRCLALLLAVYQKSAPPVITFEEPESTIHPAAMEVVMGALREGALRSQLLVTSHSPEVLDYEWLNDENLRAVESRAGKTIITPITERDRSAIRDRLFSAGELLRAGELRADRAGLDDRQSKAASEEASA